MAQSSTKSAVLIAGPTASGKSALAMAVAAARNGVIINADSMQVYRELRLLTARPSVEEETRRPHMLYGHVAGAEDYSVARWLAEAKAAMQACWAEGRVPVLCGGTGLYFMALENGLAEVPPIPPAVREHWRSFDGDLHAALQARDPESARRLRAEDRQRIIRALEVVEGTGKPLLQWQAEAQRSAFLADVDVERLYVQVPRDVLHARAERRFDAMMAAGALAEVRAMPELLPRQPLMKAIGVPQLQAHLAGTITLDDAIRDAKAATRQYIKRQTTWWRGHMADWRVVEPPTA